MTALWWALGIVVGLALLAVVLWLGAFVIMGAIIGWPVFLVCAVLFGVIGFAIGHVPGMVIGVLLALAVSSFAGFHYARNS